MNKKLNDMQAELGVITAEARSLIDLAEKEERNLTSDEVEKYDKMMADSDSLESRIDRELKLVNREARINDRKIPDPIDPSEEHSDGDNHEDVELRAVEKYLSGARDFDENERRALQADSDIYGGFTVAPQKFITKLIKSMDNNTFVRGLATVIKVNKAASLGVPSLDNDPADPIWTAEVATGDEDSTMSFGKRELNPHPLAKRIKVSEKLLRVSTISIESLVRERLAYKSAVVQENVFLNGHGNNQPLGLFTASDNGITTSQDVSTDNTTTAITCDGLINALYDLKEGYQRNASWIFHRDAIKMIRKLKDGDGQYIWNPGITTDRPATILDRPYHISEYAPNTFTTAQYVGLIGDIKHYWIAEALNMRIQRLNELYAEANKVGYILRAELDGQPVLAEAFRRIKLA